MARFPEGAGGPRWTRNGKRLSAIGYISKQMTQQAWWGRGLIRKDGGPIVGKRGGVTMNIGWRARVEFLAVRGAPRSIPIPATAALPETRSSSTHAA